MSLLKLRESILDIIYPKRCPMCKKILPIDEEVRICDACIEELPYISDPRCGKCSKPVIDELAKLCFDCSKAEHYYEQGWALWLYEGKVKHALHGLKNNNNENYGRIFGEEVVTLYYRDILRRDIDMIIPVPLHPKKLRSRGYNQAEIIAESISEVIDIPCHKGNLIRTIHTRPQKELSDIGRIQNLKRAFLVTNPDAVSGKRILLCDDIYTTGSTINGCAKALLSQGAREIYFVTIAIGKGF